MPFNFDAFLDSDGPWAAIAQVLWVLELALIIHVYKTGRPYWWIYILFIAPSIGGHAYVFIELVPDGHGKSYRFRHFLTQAIDFAK